MKQIKEKKKKEDGFFMWLLVIFLMMFYPTVSFIEYFHTKDKTVNKKRFIYYGILGTIGIAAFIIAFFAHTLLQRIALAAIASAFYIPGRYKLENLLIEKMSLGNRLFI